MALTVPAAAGGAVAPAPCDGDIYGRLVRARRVWAIGAVHAEAERLERLHARLAERVEPGDRLVYLGNYLGYGAAATLTLDALLSFRRAFLARRNAFAGDIVFLRGSQEEMWQKLLQLQLAPNPREVLPWMLDHGVGATLQSYGVDPKLGLAACREGALAITRWTAALRAAIDGHPGHRPLLSALRRAAFTESGELLFVHAAVDPGKPLDLQRDTFWWGGGDILDLAQPYAGFHRVVRGYDRRHAGLVEGPHALSLDGGCGFGGPLLAACLTLDGKLAERLEA